MNAAREELKIEDHASDVSLPFPSPLSVDIGVFFNAVDSSIVTLEPAALAIINVSGNALVKNHFDQPIERVDLA